jgi:hypothetical protein
MNNRISPFVTTISAITLSVPCLIISDPGLAFSPIVDAAFMIFAILNLDVPVEDVNIGAIPRSEGKAKRVIEELARN